MNATEKEHTPANRLRERLGEAHGPLGELLEKIVQVEPRDSSDLAEPLVPAAVGPILVLALRTGAGSTTLVKFHGGGSVELDEEGGARLDASPFEKLADAARRAAGAEIALALRTDALDALARRLADSPYPLRMEHWKDAAGVVLSLLRDYGVDWEISPRPIFLRPAVRGLLRFLGLPYDLSRLHVPYLTALATEGAALGIGGHSRHAFVLLEGDRVRRAYILEVFDGGPRSLASFPAEALQPIFDGADSENDRDLEQRIKEGKFLIWNERCWVNYATTVQVDFLKNLLDLVRGRRWSRWSSLPALALDLRRLGRKAGRGGVFVYPNLIARKVAAWARERSPLELYPPLLQVPFRRYRPKERGPLYVHETIVAAFLALGGGSLLLLWLT